VTQRVEQLDASVLAVQSSFSSLVEYFGESSVDTTPESLFGSLAKFLSDLDVCQFTEKLV